MSTKQLFITCKKHGKQKHVAEKRNASYTYYRCVKCRSEAVQRRRRKLKVKAVAYKGGECELCGYNKCDAVLEFHHRDPSQKDFGISNGGCTWGWEKIKTELDKCVMLCANCHRELHCEIDTGLV